MIIPTIGLCLVYDYGLKYKTESFLYGNKIVLMILLIINVISILIYPNGMYIGVGSGYADNWFLGYRNNHILFILPFIITSVTLSIYKKGKICLISIIDLLFSILSLIIAKSSTSIIGVFLFLIFVIFENCIYNNKLFDIKNYIVTYIITYFSIIIFRVQYLFKFLIVDMLGKDITFTNRTFIWDYVLKFIKNKPIIGYGYELGEKRFFKTDTYRSYHAHNQILEVIYKSGFIGLIAFLLIVLEACNMINKYKNTKIAKFFSFSIFTIFIMMLTEAYSFEYFMYIFVLFSNIDRLLIKERIIK